METNPAKSTMSDWPFSYFKFDKERDSADQVRNAILVVAGLVANASYQAMMSPPDVIIQGSQHRLLVYNFANTLAWSSSFTIIEMLTTSFPFQRELRLSYWSMGFAYGLVASAHINISFGVVYITLLVGVFAPYILRWLPTCIRNKCGSG